MKNKISTFLLGSALVLAAGNFAFAQDKTVKIGALSDQSGLYSDLGGPGSGRSTSSPAIISINPTSA
jgi:branched-chain amino acid transport system substrate-binding protein